MRTARSQPFLEVIPNLHCPQEASTICDFGAFGITATSADLISCEKPRLTVNNSTKVAIIFFISYELTVTNFAAFLAWSITSSIGVSKLLFTNATPILLYGRDVGFPNIRKSVLG